MLRKWVPEDAIVVLTGASSGIGHQLAQLLASRGATVIAVARREHKLALLVETARDMTGRVISFAGDITTAETRHHVLEMARDIGDGRLDLLVNNAGVGAIGPFADASPDRLRQIMEVNFFAPAELSRAAIPLLRLGRYPVLCNVCSVLGHRAVPDKSEYCASKFALHGWSDSLRSELSSDGIQVTLVSPSTTESEFFDSVIDNTAEVRPRSYGSWSVPRVARATLAAIINRRSEVILSLGGKALVYGDRFSPPLMNRLLGKR